MRVPHRLVVSGFGIRMVINQGSKLVLPSRGRVGNGYGYGRPVRTSGFWSRVHEGAVTTGKGFEVRIKVCVSLATRNPKACRDL